MFTALSKVGWFFATPSNLLPSLVLLGLLAARWPRFRPHGMALSALSALTLLVAGFSPLATWVTLPLENRFPPYLDDGQPLAGVIVLGGAVQADVSLARGQLQANEAGERLVALADLARRYPAARIVFSGGSGALLREEPAEADVLRRFAGTLGLEPERILFEGASRTTYENAQLTRGMVDPRPGERWLLVTSAWHMPRAIGCFRQAGFDVVAYPVDFRTGGAMDLWKPFDVAADGLRRLDLAAKEWAGLLAYRFAGHVEEVFPAPH